MSHLIHLFMQIAWWHWLVGGMILMCLELAIPSLFLLWVGLAAVLVGILAGLLPVPLALQLFLWAAFSLTFTWLWFKLARHPGRTRADQSQTGQLKEGVIGVRGLLTREITDLTRGEVLFQSPVLGSDRWPATADNPIKAGERVYVVDIQAQTLKVSRLGTRQEPRF